MRPDGLAATTEVAGSTSGDGGETTPVGKTRRGYQRLRRLVLAVLVLACLGPLSLNLVDPDLWGHVLYAEEWIAEGELPRTATHTYTAVGHPWVNHENLAELAFAYGFRALGVQGMLGAKVILGMAILLMMSLVARRQGVRPIAAWATLLLIAHNLQAFFPMRPQLLSFLWCAVMLLALERAFAGWGSRRTDFQYNRRKNDPKAIDWRWLLPLPVLFALWANSHGGFVAGMSILFAVCFGRAAELVLRRSRHAWRNAAGLAAIAAACGAATLVNPYGVGLHRWMAASLGGSRPEITEWGPPLPGNPVFWPFVTLVVVAVVSLALSDRRRDPLKLLVLALVGWQAASHLRHIAFFALLCGFWLPPHVQSVVGKLRRLASDGLPTASLAPWMRNAAAVVLAGVIGLQATALGRRVASFPVYRMYYPVDAVQWMADTRAKGNLLVCFNWAQYAIAALGPDIDVAFDGRFRTCYPQSVIDRHFDFLMGDLGPRSRSPESGPIDGARTLEIDRPDYVLIDRSYPQPVAVMQQASAGENSPWLLVYQDATAQLWGRRDVVDDPESSRYVPPELRFVSDHFTLTSVEWPALPRRRTLAQAFGETNEVALRAVETERRAPEEG